MVQDEESGNNRSMYILLCINALLGLIMFEWAWCSTSRCRTQPVEVDDLFPTFRRVDARRWRKWRFYPGAMTLLLPRLIGSITAGLLLVVQISICMLCHDRSKPLQDGCRKWCLKWVYNIGARSLGYWIFFAHYSYKIVSLEEVNYYEEWLGTREE